MIIILGLNKKNVIACYIFLFYQHLIRKPEPLCSAAALTCDGRCHIFTHSCRVQRKIASVHKTFFDLKKQKCYSKSKISKPCFLSLIIIHPAAKVATARTRSVVSDDQDGMVGPLAGAVVLDDSTQVILPADSINDSSQGTVIHQMTHHGLFLTTEEEQQKTVLSRQQDWPQD